MKSNNLINRLFKNKIYIILIIALAVRLAVFFIYQPFGVGGNEKLLISDANGYHKLAVGLVKGEGFGKDDPFLSTLRTPGYPAFMAIIYFMFGIKPWIVIVFQIFADVFLVYLIYKMAEMLFGEAHLMLQWNKRSPLIPLDKGDGERAKGDSKMGEAEEKRSPSVPLDVKRSPSVPLDKGDGKNEVEKKSPLAPWQENEEIPLTPLIRGNKKNALEYIDNGEMRAGEKIALISAGLWAIEPFAIFYANSMLSDSLFVLVIVISFYYLIKFLRTSKSGWLAAGAMSLAVSAYIRPVSLFLGFIIAIMIIMTGSERLKIRFKNSLVYAILFCLTLLPWYARNKMVHQHLFFSTSGAYNSLILYTTPITAKKLNISLEEAKRHEETAIYFEYGNLAESDPYLFYQKYQDRAFEIIRQNPLLFMKEALTGIADMYFSMERQNFDRFFMKENDNTFDAVDIVIDDGILSTAKMIFSEYQPATIIYALILLLFLMMEYVMARIGIIILFFKNNWRAALLITITILYFTVISLSAGLGRFKLPMIPMYLILIAVALTQINKIHSITKRPTLLF